MRGGAGSNGATIGARVKVSAGARSQVREVSGGNSGNQDPLLLYFGLADWPVDKPVKVEVAFSSGKRSTREITPCNTCTIDEKDALPPRAKP